MAGFDSEIQVRYHPAAGDEGDLAKWTAYVRHVVDAFASDRHVVAMTITNEVNLNISENTSDGAYQGARQALIDGIVAARDEADRRGRRDLRFGFTYAYRWQPGLRRRVLDRAPGRRRAVPPRARVRRRRPLPRHVLPARDQPAELARPGDGQGPGHRARLLHAQGRPRPRRADLGHRERLSVRRAGRRRRPRPPRCATWSARPSRVSGTYGVTDYRWFNLRDNLTGSGGIFDTTGLLRDDYSEKPAFGAYRDLVAAEGAAAPAGLRAAGSGCGSRPGPGATARGSTATASRAAGTAAA